MAVVDAGRLLPARVRSALDAGVLQLRHVAECLRAVQRIPLADVLADVELAQTDLRIRGVVQQAQAGAARMGADRRDRTAAWQLVPAQRIDLAVGGPAELEQTGQPVPSKDADARAGDDRVGSELLADGNVGASVELVVLGLAARPEVRPIRLVPHVPDQAARAVLGRHVTHEGRPLVPVHPRRLAPVPAGARVAPEVRQHEHVARAQGRGAVVGRARERPAPERRMERHHDAVGRLRVVEPVQEADERVHLLRVREVHRCDGREGGRWRASARRRRPGHADGDDRQEGRHYRTGQARGHHSARSHSRAPVSSPKMRRPRAGPEGRPPYNQGRTGASLNGFRPTRSG